MIPRIILASTSPRRIDLLRQIGLTVIVRSPKGTEDRIPGETPRKLVARLARQKATSVFLANDPAGTIVIAADTIVVTPDGKRVLNKPTHRGDAQRMLRLLSGKTHTVLTGYCLATPDGNVSVRVVTSRVKMRPLSPSQINRYVGSGEPMDKAGSYAAQGLGMVLIEGIHGSYTNVVGLPVAQLAADLERIHGLRLLDWKK